MLNSAPRFPFDQVLPLRALVVTLRFTTSARLHHFHQPALTGFLRQLLGHPPNYDTFLTIDAPESGRTRYRVNDEYCFMVIGLAGAEPLLARLIDCLNALPLAATPAPDCVPFRNNMTCASILDYFSGSAVAQLEDLTLYSRACLDREAAIWTDIPAITLRWLSPVRLSKDKAEREQLKGEARFCRNADELSFALLANRLHDSVADLLRRRGQNAASREAPGSSTLLFNDHFWVDSRYRDADGKEQSMGGLMGTAGLGSLGVLSADQRALWVLGQYIGIGQRRAFGWGRYRLETTTGDSTYVDVDPVASVVEQAAFPTNLAGAHATITANLRTEFRNAPSDPEAREEWAWAVPDSDADAGDERRWPTGWNDSVRN
jgi:hypothetical protein